ncbi:60S ribosomal protein L31 [Blyttiomyces sp. JEL0837]|nr:60S ribosomal protein L31 [Blyttiomyces sp. JEL0837]
MRTMFRTYQIFLMMLKLDIFFVFGFGIQFLVLIIKPDDPEFAITIAAIPILMIVLAFAVYGVRQEDKWIMGLFMTGLVLGLGYFSFKLLRIYTQPAKMAKDAKSKKSAKTLNEVVTREFTIHLHKHVFGRTFKKRAPHAIKVIKSFAEKAMGTKDVRLDPTLNHAVWARGVKSVPHRIRVRLARKRNDAEDAAEKLFTLVTAVPVTSFKGLTNQTVEDA